MNQEHVEIEVEAGMRVADFVKQLDTKYGLALDMMGNYAGQTIAGVANTSTHGSGIFSGTLVTQIVVIRHAMPLASYSDRDVLSSHTVLTWSF